MVANELSEGSVGRMCSSRAVATWSCRVFEYYPWLIGLWVEDLLTERSLKHKYLVFIRGLLKCFDKPADTFSNQQHLCCHPLLNLLCTFLTPLTLPSSCSPSVLELSKQRRRHLDPVPDLTWQSCRRGDQSGSDLSLRQQHLRKSSFCVLWHDAWESLLTVSMCLRWRSGSAQPLWAPGDRIKLSVERNLKRFMFLCPNEKIEEFCIFSLGIWRVMK